MYQYILQEKKLFLTLLLWMAVGMASSAAAMVVIPLHLLSMRNKQAYLLLLLGLWFLFLLSDSRQGFLRFAQSAKPLAMVVVSFLVWEERNYWPKSTFHKAFIPFFALAAYSWFDSPVPFISLQKMVAYFLLLFILPQLVHRLLELDKKRFLKGLVALGVLALLIGLALRFVAPGLVIFKGARFSGLLGNPNGLGIFTFCFLMLYFFIRHYHRHYFTSQEHWIILGSIVASLALAGSRGGIFSSLLFITGYYLFQRSVVVGLVTLSTIFISYQLVMANFVEIIGSLGLQEYFRVETLEKGSGRLVAYEFALKHIQYNYWWGKGWGYAEYLMHQYKDFFLQKGHQGNVHNSYLTMWLDVGLIGLIAFCWGWLVNVYKTSLKSPLAWAVLFGCLLTTTVESWLVASMNPFTIQLVIILSLLGNDLFYAKHAEKVIK